MRFLFGESLKKHKEKDEIQSTGCFARLKLCNNQSESNMGDSILSQEIEALKQLVKEVWNLQGTLMSCVALFYSYKMTLKNSGIVYLRKRSFVNYPSFFANNNTSITERWHHPWADRSIVFRSRQVQSLCEWEDNFVTIQSTNRHRQLLHNSWPT